MPLPKQITIVEVGPRDGLQNEPNIIPTERKIEFINTLSDSGLTVIETTSFVSPKWVPQMADHAEVMQGITRKPGVHYPVLVPNVKGFDAALKVDVKDIAVFTAASNTFTQKNTNCTIQESLQTIESLCEKAQSKNIRVRGYISCAVACPFEGETDLDVVADIAKQLIEFGCYEISLGDTIGVAIPEQMEQLIIAVRELVPVEQLAVHCHNTQGRALENIQRALELGVSVVDSSAGGLGGCPYAPGASGNVATEDVLALMEDLGLETGVDIEVIRRAARIVT